jgi:uncharacterized membrane protein
MAMLILGLLLFLGVHSTRVFAEGWRDSAVARIGEGPWKGIYALASLLGLALLIWGYAQARGQVPLWNPPAAMRYVTVVLMLPVFPMFIAPYVPGNGVRATLHHPQVLSVKLWAFAHLLSNGSLADVLLFGGFLAWAVLAFRAARTRDRAAGTVYPPGTLRGTVICIVVGLAIYAAFLMGLHRWMVGVAPI